MPAERLGKGCRVTRNIVLVGLCALLLSLADNSLSDHASRERSLIGL